MINKQERLDKIRQIKAELIFRAKAVNSKFAIITTGSVEYGFNDFQHGDLDDVDTMFIVSDEISYAKTSYCNRYN